MILIADENVQRTVVEGLRQAGHGGALQGAENWWAVIIEQWNI